MLLANMRICSFTMQSLIWTFCKIKQRSLWCSYLILRNVFASTFKYAKSGLIPVIGTEYRPRT
jgi:hypothetical protein